MAIDMLDVTRMTLRDFGQSASIGGAEVPSGILFNYAPAAADPYLQDQGHDGPSCCLLQEDLVTINQWPLVATDIVTGEHTYRILRCDPDQGEITMFLRRND